MVATVKDERQTCEIDYNKIRSSKVEMMRRFKEAHDKAKAEGTITYKPIKFRSSNEPLHGVLCG